MPWESSPPSCVCARMRVLLCLPPLPSPLSPRPYPSPTASPKVEVNSEIAAVPVLLIGRLQPMLAPQQQQGVV